jgi:hypothetical protein
MNAAIRAVVRCGTDAGLPLFRNLARYEGLLDGDVFPLDNRAVGGISERSGTMLRSARSREFVTKAENIWRLFDCDGFGEVPWLVNVCAAPHGGVIGTIQLRALCGFTQP